MSSRLALANGSTRRDGCGHGLLRAAHYVLVLSLASTVTGAEGIVLRASVTPDEVWVGQRTSLYIDVLGRDGWAQIKKIGDVEIPGAYVVRTQSQGVRLQENIGGDSYTGQRYELSIYPQRGGTIAIPALPVEVTIKAWGLSAAETVQSAEVPGTTFTCRVPAGAEHLRGLISTTQLTARQRWEPQTDDVNVGDAITRTITLQAADVSGMAFTPIEYPALDGLGIYPTEPTVEDRSDRGSLTGTRAETVTYVFERPGQVEIPGVILPWWDVQARALKRIELPGLTVQIVGSLATESSTAAPTAAQRTAPWWPVWAGLAVLAAVIVRFRSRLLAWWKAWREARGEAEAVYFQCVMRSIRSGDPRATLRETMRWLDRINTDPSPARLDAFLDRYGEAQAQEAADHLMTCFASAGEDCDFAAFGRGLAAARTRWRRQRGQRTQAGGAPYHGLHPDGFGPLTSIESMVRAQAGRLR